MKFPAPPSHRLSHADLLDQVRAELRRRYPAVADVLDVPGDPGWMLVEQMAFMAEALSASLDAQPRSVVEYFLSLLGRDLRPSSPALGVVAVEAEAAGVLDTLDGLSDGQEPPRVVAPADDVREEVHFAFLERSVPVRPGRVIGLYRLEGGRLVGAHRVGFPFPDSHIVWRGPEGDLDLLEKELFTYTIDRKPDEALKEVVERLTEAFGEDGPANLGWLFLRRVIREDKVELLAEIDPTWPFPRTGERRRAKQWGRLRGWQPRIEATSEHDDVRLAVGVEGIPELSGCPEALDTADLLRTLEPAPPDFAETLWSEFRSLLGEAAALLPTKPRVVRDAQAPASTPEWLSPMPYEAHWARLTDSCGLVAALDFGELKKGERFRVAMVYDALLGDEKPPNLEVLEPDGSVKTCVPAWVMPQPLPVDLGPRACAVVVYEVEPHFAREGGVVVVHGPRLRRTGPPPRAVFLNPAAVVNAPLDFDGRSVDVELGPGEVDLLWNDIVSEEMQTALRSVMPDAAVRPMKRLLDAFPLASLTVLRGEKPVDRLENWKALVLDSVEGSARFGLAADPEQRRLAPGTTLQLDWYRHTDGPLGNLRSGEITEVRQTSGQEPAVVAVFNPVPTALGQAAESTEAAMARLFGPERGAVPAVPADLERIAREALGAKEQSWLLRVWTHSERMLLASASWGVEHGEAWSRRVAKEGLARLDELGPQGVVVALGDPNEPLEEASFVSMASAVRSRVRAISDRVPHIQDCVVLPLHALRLVTTKEVDRHILPCFRPTQLPFGALRDAFDDEARQQPLPQLDLWLDAAVVAFDEARPEPQSTEYARDEPGFAEMKIVPW